MSHREVAAKVRKLEAVTVARGASPAEAETAASLARRLIGTIASRDDWGRAACATHAALAPGVHVNTVSHAGVRAGGC